MTWWMWLLISLYSFWILVSLLILKTSSWKGESKIEKIHISISWPLILLWHLETIAAKQEEERIIQEHRKLHRKDKENV